MSSQFFGAPFEGVFLGLADLLLVTGEALFDVVVTLDHHAPEPCGELACQRLGGDQAAAARGQDFAQVGDIGCIGAAALGGFWWWWLCVVVWR